MTIAYAPLTPRQSEIVELVARGLTNRQIAELLYLDESTIKSHLWTVAMRLKLPVGGSRRVHVARWFWEHYELPGVLAEDEKARTDAEMVELERAGTSRSTTKPALTTRSDVPEGALLK